MSDDNQIHLTNGGPSYLDMDDAFCVRMRDAIAAGLENAPTGPVDSLPQLSPAPLG
jgi:hypothetical protein